MSNLCPYFPSCTACTLWDLKYEQQKADKVRSLSSLFQLAGLHIPSEIKFSSCGEHSLRHRIDFSLRSDSDTGQTEFGFMGADRKLVPIQNCLQMSPELQKVFTEFIRFKFHIGASQLLQRASIRLRVGPSGLKGCWIDAANVDIKSLLDDGFLLSQLLTAGFVVEMGQKGKRVVQKNGRFKFTDPEPQIWFQAFDSQPLQCLVSDFTQPSWITAKALVETVTSWVKQSQLKSKTPLSLVEFGAGIGQFTVPLLAEGFSVTALEIEESSAQNLKQNVLNLDLTENFKVLTGDFHRQRLDLKTDLVFVNPARSGLKDFCSDIIKSEARDLIYVSCFAESMTKDLIELKSHYRLNEVRIVDQFPQTEHFETCVWLTRI